MKNFKDLLSQFGQNAQPEIEIPFTNVPAMPENYNEMAAEESYVPEAAPVRAPAGQSSSSETMTKTSSSVSGKRPQDNAPESTTPESPEGRLERLMKELKAQRDTASADAASREFKANMVKAVTDNVGNMVGGAQAMNTGASVKPVQVQGYDIGDLVGKVDKRYAGDTTALMEQYKQLLKAKDQAADARYREDSLNVQREGNRIKEKAADQKVNNMKEELTPGQESQDKDFGKKNNEWTTTGRAKFDSHLGKLEDALAQLEALPEKEKKSSDNVLGRLPDMLQPEGKINIRELVRSAAQESLRATLGAQFTENEGRAIMDRAYDPTLSPASNIKRVKAVIAELKQSRDANNGRSKEFESKGTLSQLRTGGNRAPADNTITTVGPQDQKALDWANANPNDPRAVAIKKKLGM